MRIGVIDVGSNTTRLLVASAGPKGLDPLETEKLRLSLGEEIERHGVVSDVHVAAAAKAVAEMAQSREARARRLARRLSHGSRPPGGQLRRARRGAVAGGRSPGTCAHEGGGGHARLPRRRPHRGHRPAGAHRRLRHRRSVDGDRRRQPGQRPRLDRVRRSRFRPAHRSRRGHALRGRGRVRSPRPAARRSRPRRRRERPRRAPARGRRARRDRAGRGAADRRDDSAARGRPPFRRRPRAGRDPAGRRRSCSPRCSGGSASRCTSAAAASARAPSWPRSTRSPRSPTAAGSSRTTSPVLEHDSGALLQAAADERLDDVAVRAADDAVLLEQTRAQPAPSPSPSRSSSSSARPSAAASGSTVWTQRTYGLETTRRTPNGRRSSTSSSDWRLPLLSRGRRTVVAARSRGGRRPSAWRSRTLVTVAPAAAGRATS